MSSQDTGYVRHLNAAERTLESLATLRPNETRIAEWKGEITAIKAGLATCLANTRSTNWGEVVEAASELLGSIATLIESIDPTFADTHHVYTKRLSELSPDRRVQWDVLESLSLAWETFGTPEDDPSVRVSEARIARDNDEVTVAGSLHDEEVTPQFKERDDQSS